MKMVILRYIYMILALALRVKPIKHEKLNFCSIAAFASPRKLILDQIENKKERITSIQQSLESYYVPVGHFGTFDRHVLHHASGRVPRLTHPQRSSGHENNV
jgi:hypothetical protein